MKTKFVAPINHLSGRYGKWAYGRVFNEDPTPDPTPPNPPAPTGGDDVTALQAQITSLKEENAGLVSLKDKLRGFERNYNRVVSALGDLSPEKLKEIQDAQQKADSYQTDLDQKLLAERQKLTTEHNQKFDALSAENAKLVADNQAIHNTYDKFKAFTQSGKGIGDRFLTFDELTVRNVATDEKGVIEIRDDDGKLLTFKPEDPKEKERQATLSDFTQMILNGQVDSYNFAHASSLKLCFQPYNGSSGGGLPTRNGQGGNGEDIHNMSNQELFEHAFG